MVRAAPPTALLAALALIASADAKANVGIPMLVLALPAYVVALVPVVLIEALLGVHRLGLSWSKALGTTAVGNLWSTFLGIPIVWILLLGLEFVVGGSASLLDLGNRWDYVLFPFMIAWVGGDDVWTVYFAFVLLAIPFCIASNWIEQKVALRRLPKIPAAAVREWVRDANIWSYVLLVAVAIAYPLSISAHAT
jgi:hypothetical protein